MITFKPKFITVLPMSQEIIDAYKGPGNMLRHCRWGKGYKRYAIMSGNSLAAYIVWSPEEHEVKALEVIERCRGLGLAKELLLRALEEGINLLTVNSHNVAAINLYESLGYKTYKTSGVMMWMKKE